MVDVQRVYDEVKRGEIEYLITEFDPNEPYTPSTDVGVALAETAAEQKRALRINESLNALLLARRERATSGFLVEWKYPTRVPKGIILGKHVVRWTQHGLVKGGDGSYVGTYERIRDLDGPDRDENLMAIFLD